ncbi:hypothetical protein [Noviherbaspirillum aerium]|uniref:hypothetical protein n=1 Tax=Noviherbaspirillum aerium TaxID=2588497 RepID=UPI001CEFA400|nr:hypothetical protein [Noviherbaspirillum aerium]
MKANDYSGLANATFGVLYVQQETGRNVKNAPLRQVGKRRPFCRRTGKTVPATSGVGYSAGNFPL